MPFPNKDTQFKPGESGNPHGRPKDARNRRTLYKQIADLPISAIGANIDGLESNTETALAAVIQLARKALIEQDVNAIEKLIDGAYGKESDKLDITGDMQHEFTVRVVNAPDTDGR